MANTRKVIDVDTGIEYDSVKEAAKMLGLSYFNLRKSIDFVSPLKSKNKIYRIIDKSSVDKYIKCNGLWIDARNIESYFKQLSDAYDFWFYKKMKDKKEHIFKVGYPSPVVCVETGKVYKTSLDAWEDLGICGSRQYTVEKMITTLCSSYSHAEKRKIHLLSLYQIDKHAKENGLEIVEMDKNTWRKFVKETLEYLRQDLSVLKQTEFENIKVNDTVKVIGHSIGEYKMSLPIIGTVRGICPGTRHPITVDAGGRVLYVNPREVIRV